MKSPIIGARALLFVALSGAAVPACQHYEAGGGKPDRDQARSHVTAPTGVGAESSSAVAPSADDGLGMMHGDGRFPPSPAAHPPEPHA